ncbi:sterol-binding protein [Crenobacter sp. SG2305]|uniref:ubiquinone biosynthesis accessory factor UbiJ n=1 Tax=Crenobacter oryzisoli TaxID=3056844 RepID=UPI0025AA9CD6|nr:SCP2 sterol-binding domain-containing protein [Crenobacter sp. SG2305]MDN0084393.1 sterol-binding protein [Crenobacter sp. SG2305]
MLSLALINHLLNQRPVAREELARHAGRRIAFTLPPVTVRGVLTEQGWLADSDGEAEAGVTVSHGAVLTALSGRDPDLTAVKLSGDTELATTVARVFGQLKWDAGEDLSRLVGDVAANRVERFVRSALGIKGEIGGRLLESWIEHLREEAPLLARKHDVAHFVADIDALRDDVERLDKRLERLADALARRAAS